MIPELLDVKDPSLARFGGTEDRRDRVLGGVGWDMSCFLKIGNLDLCGLETSPAFDGMDREHPDEGFNGPEGTFLLPLAMDATAFLGSCWVGPLVFLGTASQEHFMYPLQLCSAPNLRLMNSI